MQISECYIEFYYWGPKFENGKLNFIVCIFGDCDQKPTLSPVNRRLMNVHTHCENDKS